MGRGGVKWETEGKKGMAGGEEELEPCDTTVDQAAGRRC